MTSLIEPREYEQKVWRRGPLDWRWELREAHKFSVLLAAGMGTSRKHCREQIGTAIDHYEAKTNAKWKPVVR